MLWELGTRGETPYGERLRKREDVPRLVFEGVRPPVNDGWDLIFKVLMTWCWHKEADKRPSSHHIFGVLDGYWKLLVKLGEKEVRDMDPDDLFESLLQWCTNPNPALQPTFAQVTGLYSQYKEWKNLRSGQRESMTRVPKPFPTRRDSIAQRQEQTADNPFIGKKPEPLPTRTLGMSLPPKKPASGNTLRFQDKLAKLQEIATNKPAAETKTT